MFTVALISRKGGAGKTTLACGIAVAGERARLTTVLVDLDPQGSASAWVSLRELGKIQRAWPDLHYRTVKGALVLSPSPPRIPPSQLRLVE